MTVKSYNIRSGKRYMYRFSYKNKVYQKSGFLTLKEAKSAQIKRYEFLYSDKTSDILFEELVNEYLEYSKAFLKESSYFTIFNNIKSRIIPYFGRMKLCDITTINIREYLMSLIKSDISSAYFKNLKNSLRSIFIYCVNHEKIHTSPMDKLGRITFYKPVKRNIWTYKEFAYFIEHIEDKQSYLAYNLLFFSGARIGEILALKWEDIDFLNKEININSSLYYVNNKNIITTPKTQSSIRKVKLPDKTIDLLKEYYENNKQVLNDLVFTVSRSFLSCKLKQIIRKFNLKNIRLHDLRHSHACLLLGLGINLTDISKRLGHENIQTTIDIYGKNYFPNEEKIIDSLNKVF